MVVGSGFGGSVSALRLAEKGYSVAVLECGSRFRDEDFAASTLREPRRYFWWPKWGMRGVLRMTFFKDVFVVSGSGVGGGSLGYANTLYRARPSFFQDRQWADLGNWEAELTPHYDTAERMLGVVEYEGMGPADVLLKEYAEEIGVGETFTNTKVGVFFDKPGVEVEDPFFEGEGPARTGCMRCGSCMVGCRHGAKNTLMKNYLWFAEKLGVRIFPERQVTEIRPLGAADGSDGYEVTHERSGSWFRKRRHTVRARGVVVAAGALGTNNLLANCKHSGALPRLSDRVGAVIRTNSESIQSVTARDDDRDFSRSVAITSSIYPDPDTHIEVVTYGEAGDIMSNTFTAMAGPGTRLTRPLKWLARAAPPPPAEPAHDRPPEVVAPHRDPARHADRRRGDAPETEAQAVRQGRAAADRAGLRAAQPDLPAGRRRGGPLVREQDRRHRAERADRVDPERADDRPHPRRRGGRSGRRRAASSTPATASSATRTCWSPTARRCRPTPGVNPSLTITAKAEHAMSQIPLKEGEEPRHLPKAARPAIPVAPR